MALTALILVREWAIFREDLKIVRRAEHRHDQLMTYHLLIFGMNDPSLCQFWGPTEQILDKIHDPTQL